MSNVEYRKVNDSDILYLSENIRENDIMELSAVFPYSVFEAIDYSVKCSSMLASVYIDNKLNAILGVCPKSKVITNTIGIPWMLGTDDIYTNRKVLCSEYDRIINQMLTQFSLLENYVDHRNDKAIRFLRKAGFEIHRAQPFGLYGIPFHRFTKRI